MAASLRYLAAGKLTTRKLGQIQKWLDEDWESHDIDRDAVLLIRKLIAVAKPKA